jgi:hypothetical protein
MVKRIAAVPLWFVSIWLTYGLAAYFTGLPESAGAIVGALIAALVFMDPTGVFWGATEPTKTMATTNMRGGLDGSHSTP